MTWTFRIRLKASTEPRDSIIFRQNKDLPNNLIALILIRKMATLIERRSRTASFAFGYGMEIRTTAAPRHCMPRGTGAGRVTLGEPSDDVAMS
jgi:hypothetical protein